MRINLQVRTLLSAAVLSLAPLGFAASTALADPPGYYFQEDAMQSAPARLQAKPAVAAPLAGGSVAPSITHCG
jgi:hypothetical protein